MTDFIEWVGDVLGLTLTPYQHAVARIVGGGDPTSDIEREVWGFTGVIDHYARAIIAMRLGRRGFKTTLSASYALYRAMTADLSEAGGGAQIVIPIVAPAAPQTKLALDMAVHLATRGSLRDCINTKQHEEGRKRTAVTTQALHLIRPQDGLEVEIRAVVASAGGKNLVGFHVPAMILDEAERMRSDSEARVTDEEQLNAVMPALLPGGSVLMISTPFDLDSYMHKHIERNWKHPVDGIAAIATTRQLRTDSPMVLDMVARELVRNPTIAMRDYECIPIGRADAYFENLIVEARTIENPMVTRSRTSGAVDLAFVSDGCALVVLERQGNKIVQVLEDFVQPTVSSPLQPSIIRGRFLDALRAQSCNQCAADVHEFASLCETMIPGGVQVSHAPTGAKLTTAFALTRDYLRDGLLDVLPQTARQMKAVLTDATGAPDVLRRPGEGHADLVSALVAAVNLDLRHGPLRGAGADLRPAALRGGWTQ